jgi:hypothetical protein
MLKVAAGVWGNEKIDTENCVEIANNMNQESNSTRRD